MADDARDGGNRDGASAEEAALSARLQRLDTRLDQLRANRPRENGSDAGVTTNAAGFARGFRLSADLVCGVLFGAALGWVLDRWLGISPWGLIVFLLLGFAAGVVNVVRAAGVAPSQGSNDPRR